MVLIVPTSTAWVKTDAAPPLYVALITRRHRVIAYGSAAAAAIAGGVFAAVAHGTTADLIGITVLTLALGAIVLLVFYEIGLSEDKERAREEEQRRENRRPWRPI